MSEEKLEPFINKTGNWEKVPCPLCNAELNLQSKINLGFDKKNAKFRIWCRHQQRHIYISEYKSDD